MAYFDSGTKAAVGLLRESLHMPTRDVIHGKSYGFSKIEIQRLEEAQRPHGDVIKEAIPYSVDKKIQSKSDMATLSRYPIDMDHPCVRVYTKDEVDANRKFLMASSDCHSMHQSYSVCSYNSFHHHPSDV